MDTEQQPVKQTIALQGSDSHNVYSVTGGEVNILPSSASVDAREASNKIHVTPIFNFKWEARYYMGNLVTVHQVRSLIAIAMRRQAVEDATSSITGSGTVAMVRVRSLKDDSSTLLRGFEGRVLDVAFSYLESETLLAVIDERGTLFIFRIDTPQETKSSEMRHTLVLQIVRDEVAKTPTNAEVQGPAEPIGRVYWTRYIADENDDEDAEDRVAEAERIAVKERSLRTLLLTYNDHCIFLDVSRLAKRYAARCTTQLQSTSNATSNTAAAAAALTMSEAVEFAVIGDSHVKPITDAQVSPDGSAFATASLDGCVRFYSASLLELEESAESHVKQPIHTWFPHDHKPVYALRFLDNYRDPAKSVWRYALTAAEYNREIKLWLCTEWRCLQTIRFVESPIEAPVQQRIPVALKLAVDDSAQYIVATDVRRRVLYVLHTTFEDAPKSHSSSTLSSGSNSENEEEQSKIPRCKVSQLAEFLLSVPCLSFALNRTTTQQRSISLSDSIALASPQQQTDIHLVSVHPRQVQQMAIRYRVPPPAAPQTLGEDRRELSTTVSEMAQLMENLGLDLHSEAHSTVLGADTSLAALQSPNASRSSDGTDTARTDEEIAAINGTSPRGVDAQLIGPDAFLVPSALNTVDDTNGSASGSATLNESNVNELVKAKVAPDSAPLSSAFAVVPELAAPATAPTPAQVLTSPRTALSSSAPLPKLAQSSTLTFTASSNAATTEWVGAGSGATYQLTSSTTGDRERLAYSVSSKGSSTLATGSDAAANSNANYAALQNDMRRLSDVVAQLAQAVQSHHEQVDEQLKRINAARLPNGGQSALVTVADLRVLLDKQETAMTSRFDRELRRVQTGIEQTITKLQQAATAATNEPPNEAQTAIIRDAVLRATNECVSAAQNDLRATLDSMRKEGAAQLVANNAAFDVAMRQELAKWLAAKSTGAQISQAVAATLRNEALAAINDAFERAALPAFQRATDALFAQLNEKFQQGVAEWMAHVATVGDASNTRLAAAFEHAAREAIERLERDALQSLTETTRTAVNAALTGQSTNEVAGSNSLADAVAQAVVARLKPELATQLNDSLAGALGRSRAQTPSVAAEKRCDTARLTQLANERRYNEAFQEALSAGALRYVLHVCEQVRVTELFAIQPCPLQQPVLLSLLQQLSVSLETVSVKQLTMRIEYLQSALTCLDMNHAAVREFIPRVMQGMLKAIDLCLQKEEFAASNMQLRTLRMLAQAFTASK